MLLPCFPTQLLCCKPGQLELDGEINGDEHDTDTFLGDTRKVDKVKLLNGASKGAKQKGPTKPDSNGRTLSPVPPHWSCGEQRAGKGGGGGGGNDFDSANANGGNAGQSPRQTPQKQAVQPCDNGTPVSANALDVASKEVPSDQPPASPASPISKRTSAVAQLVTPANASTAPTTPVSAATLASSKADRTATPSSMVPGMAQVKRMSSSSSLPDLTVLDSPAAVNDAKANSILQSPQKSMVRGANARSTLNLPSLSTPSCNRNQVHEFSWTCALLKSIASNRADLVQDMSSRQSGSPLFVVAGACPNAFCGMQAVLYSLMHSSPPVMDFWWVKPQKHDGMHLERASLHRHSKGEHKNEPGRSRALYAQFADLFAIGNPPSPAAERANKAGGGKLAFELVPVGKTSRACIRELASGDRYYPYLIWQEDWTSNPFARTKFIKGHIVYQRAPEEETYFSRPYVYRDGVLSIPASAALEQQWGPGSVFPTESIKQLPPDL